MKQIEIITSESILIIGIKNDNWNPRPTIDTEFSIIPIIINDTDKDITGRIWEVKDPFIAREPLAMLQMYNSDHMKKERDMNNGRYTFCHCTNEVAYLDKVKNITYDDDTEYVHLRFTYDEKIFKSVMTKTMTIDAIHNLVNSVKTAGGYTVTYIDWDNGKPRVAGRFKTKEEVDGFLETITADGSGWTDEEISTISIHDSYNYMLPY